MSKNTSVSLGDHLNTFVTDCVKTGRFNSASDTVRAGLRLLEVEETKLKALQAALVHGEESGPSIAFDFDDFIASKKNLNGK